MEGILIAAGPAFQAGDAPRDAGLLDIAPTVLHLLGVPVPDDMDGRVLTEMLEPMSCSVIPRAGSGASFRRRTGQWNLGREGRVDLF